LVTVDKFSKWIEAVPVTNREATTAVKFFESITCRYGVPNSIITNNGGNFTSGEFQEFSKKLESRSSMHRWRIPSPTGRSKRQMGLFAAA
jgi:transposase InsO family protein